MVQTRSGRKTAILSLPTRGTKRPPTSHDDSCSDDDYSEVLIKKIFHGQLRLLAGCVPPVPGKKAARRMWKSCMFTTQEQFDRFLDAIKCTTYSMTSGQGGKRFEVPIKRERPTWGRQAVLAVISQSPFVTHKISVERRGAGRYMAQAALKEKRSLACPSGLGSFDACIFDLADGDAAAAVQMELQGKGDYLSKPCKPLSSGPEWEQ